MRLVIPDFDTQESWKDIAGLEGRYQISDHGRIKSLIRGKVLVQNQSNKGYAKITLNRKCFCVHRLVGAAFVENWDDKLETNHKDGNKLNNHYTNLESVTHLQNVRHAMRMGLRCGKGEINLYATKIKNIKTGKIYPNVRSAARSIKILPYALSQMLKGKRKNTSPFEIHIPKLMIALPNGCSRSKMYVYPKNWKTNKASTKKDWLIQYRFYDPQTKGTPDWGKDIPIKAGMNRYKLLTDRQEICQSLIDDELRRLDEGWNPILQVYVTPQQKDFAYDIDPSTPFIEALKLAEPKVDAVPAVHRDMASILKAVEKASGALFDQRNRRKYKDLPISLIESRHLIFLLEQCQKENENLTDKRYNKYLAYLSMIFNKLKQLQALQANPVENIDRKKTVTKKRAVLTDKEAAIIDPHLHKTDYYFWRYTQIFFHSSARGTEMAQLKKEAGLDLQNQEFTVLVKKGNQYKEQTRIIGKAAVPIWQEVWDEAKDGEYLFGSMLKPGPSPMGERYVSKKWQDYVKKGLGIDKDFYAWKHRRSEMIARKLSLKHAQQAAGHTSERTARIYAVGEDERRREEVKGLDITLTG